MSRVFVFDLTKSQANRVKHGIDFIEAQAMWLDEQLLEIRARSGAEVRYLVIARIDGRHWSAIITYRDEVVRIISVRRARPEERVLYEAR